MAATQSYQEAWTAYQQAVKDLYAPSASILEVERGAKKIHREQLDIQGDLLVACSENMRVSLVEGLVTEDLEQRELATLKLLAGAAYDLSVAMELMESEEADPTMEVERSAHGMLLTSGELMQMLNAPLEGGMSALLDVERSALPNNLQAARSELQDVIADFVEYIPEETTETCQKVIAGLVTLGIAPIQGAVSVGAQELLVKVPDGVSLIFRRSAQLVAAAISKIQEALGQEQAENIRKRAVEWVKEFQEKPDAVSGLLNKLYEIEKISKETNACIENASAAIDYDRYNQVTESLEELQARYAKSMKLLQKVMPVLAFAKAPLLAAVPWGPVALYTAYIGILGYTIYSGGDYLDWYRTGEREWLDRVQGLRKTVREALK
jgi:hypothetical protein